MVREPWENILTELVLDLAQKTGEKRQAKSLDESEDETNPV